MPAWNLKKCAKSFSSWFKHNPNALEGFPETGFLNALDTSSEAWQWIKKWENRLIPEHRALIFFISYHENKYTWDEELETFFSVCSHGKKFLISLQDGLGVLKNMEGKPIGDWWAEDTCAFYDGDKRTKQGRFFIPIKLPNARTTMFLSALTYVPLKQPKQFLNSHLLALKQQYAEGVKQQRVALEERLAKPGEAAKWIVGAVQFQEDQLELASKCGNLIRHLEKFKAELEAGEISHNTAYSVNLQLSAMQMHGRQLIQKHDAFVGEEPRWTKENFLAGISAQPPRGRKQRGPKRKR